MTWSDGGKRMRLENPVDAQHTYAFYVSDDGLSETMVEWFTEDGVTFETPKKYNYIFLYGKRVDDFLTIDGKKYLQLVMRLCNKLTKIKRH